MKLTNAQLKVLLLGTNLITSEQFEAAEKEAQEKNIPLLDYLPDAGFISDDHLGQIIANYFKFDYVNLRNTKIDEAVLRLIPELVARSKGVIAFSRDENAVKVGMINPDDSETRHIIEKRAGQEVLAFYITPRDLASALGLYRSSLKDEFDKLMKKLLDKALGRDERDELVVEMVDLLLEYGYQNKASDIHIEPFRKKVIVRFRIDGVMHQVLELPKDLHDLFLSRIKILAKLRTDEHRAAQDGKLQFETKDEVVDVRVSIVPITEGENAVMRLLSAKSRQFSLPDLGFSSENLKKVERAIKKPHGMILVTGPTGSGKTTTLYAFLKILNKSNIHISTIEDPVEYDLEGVSQIQVNPKTNLTFAKGLRAIVRQDPDIIMVGEIRDKETAGIAVNSALTGHLVLSTLHTNDAATSLPRLIDMAVEPFLVASTINVIVAQRLARKICEKCRTSYNLNPDEVKVLENEARLLEIIKARKNTDISKIRFYKGAGCKVCGKTGYIGRVGIFEVLEMSAEVKELVTKRATSDEIINKAREQGMKTMLEDGLEKALSGVTTLEEVMRVTKE